MKNCILILDNIRSVENVGSIFRTAEGLGVGKVVLVGTTPTPLDRFGRLRRDMAKVALGAESLLAWEHKKEIVPTVAQLKDSGYEILALEQTEKSQDIKQFESSDKFALIVGNEVEGVSRGVLDIADHVVEISMRGKKESLNVSVATGIALFKFLG